MSDSLFTIHSYEIIYKKLNEPIYLIPFGDVHRFAPLCDERRWFEFLEWASTKPRCYFLGMGDYDDMYSGSERAGFSNVKLHESSKKSLDDYYRKRTLDMVKEIRFMKNRLIGMIEGNHHANLASGITTTQLMCEELGCPYLGVSSFIRLAFRCEETKHETRSKIDIWAHHGRGGGKTIGSSMSTVEGMEKIGDADIYLMGHDHKKSVATKSKLRLSQTGNHLKLHHKKIILARTGSFLKGYEPNEDSYVAQAALSPSDLGVVKIEMTPKRMLKNEFGRRHTDVNYIDLHGSI